MRKSILGLVLFCPVFALFAGCGDDDSAGCEEGEEQICYCADQYVGIQTCENGVWGECWCAGAADSDSDSDTDVVNQALEVEVTASPSSGTAPLTVNFTAHVAGGIEPFSFAWDFGDGASSSAGPDASNEYTTDGTYTAVVTVTDDAGKQGIGSVTVDVGSDLSPTVEIVATPTLGIAPLSVDFQAVAMGGNPPYTYQWDFNGDATIDSTVVSPSSLFAAGSHEVKVTVTDSDGDTGEDTINVYAALPDQVPEVIAEIVEGECISVPGEQYVQLNGFASSDFEGAIMYEWVFVTVPMEEEDAKPGIQTLEFEPSPYVANPRFTPQLNGTYQVQLFVSDGIHTVGSQILEIEVSDEPAEVVKIAGDAQSAIARHDFEESFVAQVVNSCGAPIPYVPVYLSGFNARPFGGGRVYQFETNENGEISFPGTAGFRAGQAGMKVRAGCVNGVFDLTVVAGEAAFLVMTRFPGTPVVSDQTGASLSFEVTDEFLNPVAEKAQFGLMMQTFGAPRVGDDDDSEYYYYCNGDDDDDDVFYGGACFEEAMTEGVDDPFALDDCRNLTNLLTDENGKRTVTVLSRTDIPIRVWFHQTARIVSGTNIGKELTTFGREVYQDSFESLANWANWVKGKEDDSQWDRGVPAAGVGPSSAHTGGNLIGTNLSGDYITPEGELPVPIKQQSYPIYQDDVHRPIPSTTFDNSHSWPIMTFIEFWQWYDMIGDTCPECAAATGFVSNRDMLQVGATDGDIDADGDADSDMPYYSFYSPEGEYPGPELCYEEISFRPNGLPRWGFSGISDGWEPAHFLYYNQKSVPVDMPVMDLAFVFSTSTLGEADGAGWYIDDLRVTNLFISETGFLYIQFGHDIPDHTKICHVQDGNVSDGYVARQEPVPPMCEESANAVVLATVFDQYHNRISEPGIELLFGADDGEASMASAVFEEALKGSLVAGGGTNVARATTDEDGEIVLTIDNTESEEVEVSSDLEGVLFADDETWVYFYNDGLPTGDCCDNPIELGIDDGFNSWAKMCNYHALDQMAECGDPTRRDVVFKFQVSQSDLYIVQTYNYYGYDTIAQLSALDDDGNCPGTPVPNEGNPDEGSCIEDSMYAYLYKDKTYVLTVQFKTQNDYVNCSGSYDYAYMQVYSASAP